MPTVTVLAWCLMASTGRVSSSMPRGERGGEVLDHDARRADLAVLDLVGVERDARRWRSGAATRAAPRCSPRGGRRSGRRAGRRRTGAPAARAPARARSSRSSPARGGASTTASIAARASRSGRAWRVDRERGLVAEQVAGHRREHERRASGCTAGTAMTSSAAREPVARPRWRSRSAPPCGPGRSRPPWPRRRRSSPASPAAHTRISGSDDRSMCFLSSVASQAIDL